MLVEVLASVFQWHNILHAFVGTVLGIFFGALPGVGPTLALALLLPFTFSMGPVATLIFLGCAYGGCIYGGSISSILINTPGTSGNIATTFDGYPMAQKGEAGVALGISAMASAIGGVFSLVVALLTAPLLARYSLAFGPAEYTCLGLLGLSLLSVAAEQSTLKGLIMGCLGLLLSFVGYSMLTGDVRYTFGLGYLRDGIPLVQTITGMFAISQAFSLAAGRGKSIASTGVVAGHGVQGALMVFKYPSTLIKSCLIGLGLGVLPGVGIATAQFIAYNEAKRSSNRRDLFGKGSPEGVIASESANNAVEGGALIPTLTLGIPGSLAAAILLSALLAQGVRPGMDLFTGVSGGIATTALVGIILGLLTMMVVGLSSSNMLAKITLVKVEYIIPLVVILALTGSFAVRNSFNDMILSLVFGLVGYAMQRYGYPMAPFVLGLILGPIVEENFGRSLLISRGSYLIFVQSPIALVLLILTVISFVWPYASLLIRRKRMGEIG